MQPLAAQDPALDPQKWVTELSKQEYYDDENFARLILTLSGMDSLKAFQFLNELAKKGDQSQHHFGARFLCLQARVISLKNMAYRLYQNRKPVDNEKIKAQLIALHAKAMDKAYRSEDDLLVAFVSYLYSGTMVLLDETGMAVMYAKNAIELYEKLKHPVLPQQYQSLAELLYKVREYDESIRFAKKAILGWLKSKGGSNGFTTVNCTNTVALGYHRQQKYDSALFFYKEALHLAHQLKDTVWTGIVSGNMGQLFYAQGNYDTAYALLKRDYQWSKTGGWFDNAANSLQWAARTNLALGHKGAALVEVREAIQLLKLWPDDGYLRNAYYTTTQIFRALGAYDSAFYYNTLYGALNDSLEKVVATSSSSISKARLNDERSRYQIQNLNRDKRSQLVYRNIIISGIVVISLLALLLVNRRRLQEKLKSEKAEQEVLFAKEQLCLFTENIVEKTALIEKLEAQASKKRSSSSQQAIISELSRQTILTEKDWVEFKALFEKLYPGFFINLKESFPEITAAEHRMAALSCLHLTPSQIGAILGISVNSVHKTRQRLRLRLNLSAEKTIEDFLVQLSIKGL